MADVFVLLFLVLFPVVIARAIGLAMRRFWPNLPSLPNAMLSALPFSAVIAMLSLMAIFAAEAPPEPCVDCGLGKAIMMAALIYAGIIYPVATVVTMWLLRHRSAR